MGLTGFSAGRLKTRTVLLLAGLGLAVLLLLAPAGARAASSRRVGRRPVPPAGARPLGALAQSTRLGVTVTLQPRDPAGLAAYAAAVSDPGSSDYHHYLSVAQFARRFGPTESEIAAARTLLRGQGLEPGRLAADGLSLPVTASVARLGAAFHTGFERYHLRSGRTAFANTAPPQVSGSGAQDIQAVIGLDNLTLLKPQGLSAVQRGRATAGSALPRTSGSGSAVTPCSSAASEGYTANQIASQYGLNNLYGAGDLGSGVTVALYELEPYSSSDIAAYQSCYGTSATLTNENVDGKATCATGDSECGLEATLDIEGVIGLAPKAKILVYEGPNGSANYDIYKQIVSDDTAQVISTSWGLCEAGVGSEAQAENTLFEEAATQGQSIFAAAGDSGSDDCETNSNPPTVDDPASQPYVTGVGGTSVASIGATETVWNDGPGGGAGGGGVSTLWPTPAYQKGVIHSQSSITCGSVGYACRQVPDVSADADPYTGYAVYWGGWGGVGGTSAAAPTWASLAALADSSPACAGAPVGFANPTLYTAAGSDYGGYFNDVTSGNNGYDGVIGFSAAAGYDMASGLGTPKGAALAAALCNPSDAVTFTGTPATQTSTAGRPILPVSVSATSSTGATPISYSATGLPTGLSINSASGQITGTPTRPGSSTVSLRAIDKDGISAATTFAWVVKAPTVTLTGLPSSASARVGSAYRSSTPKAVDGAGAPVTFRASGLPAGLTINRTTGVISGTPTKATATNVRVTAGDPYGGSASRQFRFVVAGRPRISASKLHISGTKGSLSLTLRAGQYAPSLKKVELIVPKGAHLAGGRTLARYVNLFTLAGKRQAITRRLSGGKLFVTLRSSLSGAQLRLTGSELTFTRALATGLSHRTKTPKLSLPVTDAAGRLTRLTLTLR